MRLRDKPLLVDTNLILEAHRTGCWKALVGAFRVETVEKCVEETQTGNPLNRSRVVIDEKDLRRATVVQDVSDEQLFAVRYSGGAGLDDGEMHLWAHALTRKDVWILCGPDAASLTYGFKMGYKDRLVHLEALLAEIGMKLPAVAQSHFGRRWHDDRIGRLTIDHMPGSQG